MQYIADLHIHSKYSRACSKNLTVANIGKWCEIKGIDIVSTADFTHPGWFRELKENLIEAEQGLYKIRGGNSPTRFLVSTELSCIYKKGDKARRVHHCLLMPSLLSAERLNRFLEEKGFNLKSDGRPILGLSSKELLKIVLDISEEALLIPAHAWTPWFAIFGSASGYDSLEECFDEMTERISAVETGLSSDPPMNWRLSALDNITLISNSDAHSLPNLGREANVFEKANDSQISYEWLTSVIKNKDKKQFKYTIEFFPEEGKYHFDGHRECGVRTSPQETKINNFICPQCKKPLTIGVLHRVEDLADREEGQLAAEKHVPYKSLVPLANIIAESQGQGVKTKKVQETYRHLVRNAGSEFNVLLKFSLKDLENFADERIIEAISRVREGQLFIEPGYDGAYGRVRIFDDVKNKEPLQRSMF